MAFVPMFGTGFEMGSLPTKAGKITGSIMNMIAGHTGSYAIEIKSGQPTFILDTSSAELSTGMWIKHTANISAQEIRFYTDGYVIGLRATSTGYNLYINNVLVASGSVITNVFAWHNVQVWISIGVSGFVKTKLDGNIDIEYSGDLTSGSTSVIQSIDFYKNDGGAMDYSRICVDDFVYGTGDWSGDIRFDALIPNADTAVHGWKPNGISLQDSPSAPTVNITTGPGLTGDYHYKVTLVDTDGETLGGTASALIQPVDQVVALTNIPLGLEGTTARKIYRTVAGGSTYKLVATISDNTTTTYNDSLADGSLGAEEPTNIHYDKIDERPFNDADYIYIATNGAQDIHTLTDWDATKKSPLFVMQWARVKKDTADTQKLKFLLKSGISTTVKASTARDLLTSMAYEWQINLTNPDNAAWTNAELDALQSGFEAVIS